MHSPGPGSVSVSVSPATTAPAPGSFSASTSASPSPGIGHFAASAASASASASASVSGAASGSVSGAVSASGHGFYSSPSPVLGYTAAHGHSHGHSAGAVVQGHYGFDHNGSAAVNNTAAHGHYAHQQHGVAVASPASSIVSPQSILRAGSGSGNNSGGNGNGAQAQGGVYRKQLFPSDTSGVSGGTAGGANINANTASAMATAMGDGPAFVPYSHYGSGMQQQQMLMMASVPVGSFGVNINAASAISAANGNNSGANGTQTYRPPVSPHVGAHGHFQYHQQTGQPQQQQQTFFTATPAPATVKEEEEGESECGVDDDGGVHDGVNAGVAETVRSDGVNHYDEDADYDNTTDCGVDGDEAEAEAQTPMQQRRRQPLRRQNAFVHQQQQQQLQQLQMQQRPRRASDFDGGVHAGKYESYDFDAQGGSTGGITSSPQLRRRNLAPAATAPSSKNNGVAVNGAVQQCVSQPSSPIMTRMRQPAVPTAANGGGAAGAQTPALYGYDLRRRSGRHARADSMPDHGHDHSSTAVVAGAVAGVAMIDDASTVAGAQIQNGQNAPFTGSAYGAYCGSVASSTGRSGSGSNCSSQHIGVASSVLSHQTANVATALASAAAVTAATGPSPTHLQSQSQYASSADGTATTAAAVTVGDDCACDEDDEMRSMHNDGESTEQTMLSVASSSSSSSSAAAVTTEAAAVPAAAFALAPQQPMLSPSAGAAPPAMVSLTTATATAVAAAKGPTPLETHSLIDPVTGGAPWSRCGAYTLHDEVHRTNLGAVFRATRRLAPAALRCTRLTVNATSGARLAWLADASDLTRGLVVSPVLSAALMTGGGGGGAQQSAQLQQMQQMGAQQQLLLQQQQQRRAPAIAEFVFAESEIAPVTHVTIGAHALWRSAGLAGAVLEYSDDGGATFTLAARVPDLDDCPRTLALAEPRAASVWRLSREGVIAVGYLCFEQQVAVKKSEKGAVDKPKSGDSPAEEAHFYRALSGYCYTPTIIEELHGPAEDPENHWIVSEFMAGRDVYHFLNENRDVKNLQMLPEDHVAMLFAQVALSVYYMHHVKRVCHLDLKPANILLSRDRTRACVSDYGVMHVLQARVPSAELESSWSDYSAHGRDRAGDITAAELHRDRFPLNLPPGAIVDGRGPGSVEPVAGIYGTKDYMAPEIIAQYHVTQAAKKRDEALTREERAAAQVCDCAQCVERGDVCSKCCRGAYKLGLCAPHYRRKYGFDGRLADVYSLGVILFTMLTKVPPYLGFASSSNVHYASLAKHGPRYLIKAYKAQFPSINASESAIDLMTKMMRADPAKRAFIEEVVAHPWVASRIARLKDQQPR